VVTNNAIHQTKEFAESAGFRPSARHEKPSYCRRFALASELLNDADYQYRFRRDFTRRLVHPSIETLIWHHVAGKPKESIQMTGSIGFSERLKAERELFGKLSVEQLEELALASQALVDRALKMVKANALTPGAATAPRAPIDGGESNGDPPSSLRAPTSTMRSKACLPSASERELRRAHGSRHSAP
jgi:hypothetical protein